MNYIDMIRTGCSERGIELLGSRGNRFAVPSTAGTVTYTVQYAGRDCDGVGLWRCTCPATKTCKHIRAVVEIVNRAADECGYE